MTTKSPLQVVGKSSDLAAADSAAGISIEKLNKNFGKFVAVDNLSLEIQKGEFVTFLGPSGSGKTTTLMMIAGFLFPTSGDIRIGDESIVAKPSHKRNLGIVFQNYSLFPHMTISENIAFPLKMRKLDADSIKKRVQDALALVKLSDFGQRHPKQLSGGQQQRVALARALVFNPPILLMDEPLGALDKNLREAMQLEIKRIQESLNITTIYVTHDQSEALTMSDRIVVMNDGGVEQVGAPEDLYENPNNRFVASFIGESNFLEGKVTRIEGDAVHAVTDEQVEFKALKQENTTVGERICAALRPERIGFAAEQEIPSGWVTVDSVIEEEIYIGELSRYEVRISDNQVMSMKHSNRTARTQKDHELYHRGNRVKVGWNWRDAKVVGSITGL
jgi:putative spermidine/putrescine transport system ATP-binding protein